MTSYERVKAAVNHQTPDRVPCGFQAEVEVMEKLYRYFGASTPMEINRIFDIDRRQVGPRYIGPELKHFEDGSYEIIVSGGPVYKKIPTSNGTTIESCIHYPWADVEEKEDLEGRLGWCGDIAWWDFSAVKEQIDELERQGEYWITAHGDPSGLQHVSMWAGDENFLITLAADEELAVAMIEQHNKFRLEHALKTLEAGGGRIHELNGGGDYGSQNGLLISREMFCRYFKPLYEKFYREIKKNFDVKIFFHSCGSVVDLIPDLMEMGVDILDPIQTSAAGMDIAVLKEKYGKQLVFNGAIDIQSMLPYLSAEEVKKEVKRICTVLGKDGGYILAPTHLIQPDTPVENIIAMYEAAQNRKIG